MPRSPQWMDLYQIWFRVSSRGRNQLCGILLQSAHGFRFCEGSKFAISHWLGWSPLTQCWRYRAACDNIMYINLIVFNNIFDILYIYIFYISNSVNKLWKITQHLTSSAVTYFRCGGQLYNHFTIIPVDCACVHKLSQLVHFIGVIQKNKRVVFMRHRVA